MSDTLPFLSDEVRREFDPERVVELAPGVRRITAPNPGMMTGPGTNTWLLGEREVTVIDPGPADAGHVERVARAAGPGLRHIVVTHTHPDHSPAARLLAARTGAPVYAHPVALRGRRDEAFTADRTLDEGDRLEGDGYRLRVLHTPGHAANHLCLLLEGSGWLFAGDHVMYGSTVVIAPPDGDMQAYLDSLERLRREPVRRLAPAHGRLMDDADAVLSGLIAHRLQREAQIVDILGRRGPLTVDAVVAEAYRGVDPRLHPVAALTVRAHLDRLRALGRAQPLADGRWALTRSA